MDRFSNAVLRRTTVTHHTVIRSAIAATLAWWLVSITATGDTATESKGQYAIATFAGGCFWCMEPPYDEPPGVVSTISGYSGGSKKNPTYEEVSMGITGHAEVVQITYDPKKISYRKLLEVFWPNIDPTTPNRQFCDVGNQYRSAIFYHTDEQKRLALESKAALEKSKPFADSIVTEIKPASEFYTAEEYHQDYYMKNPIRYKFYRFGCGRDQRLQQLWGKTG
jgi:peptide-methionine (S)-S-oxide reductase